MTTTPIFLRVKSSNAGARRKLQSRTAVSFTSCACSRGSRHAVPWWDVAGEQPQHGMYTLAMLPSFSHRHSPAESSHSWQIPHSWECSNAAVSQQKVCMTVLRFLQHLHTPTLFFLHSRIKTQVLDYCFSSNI